MDLKRLHKLAKELEDALRMRAHAVAVKLIKGKRELPKKVIIPTRDWGHKYSFCQSLSRSQRFGETIAMFVEDHWCPGPLVALGMAKRSSFFLEGNHRYPDSVKDKKAAHELTKNMPFLKHGRYTGVVSAPLISCGFLPDVIYMHINGLMATTLVNARNWIDGKDIHAQISGHASCVYSIVPSILNGDCNLAVPCKGDRRFAGAQDDEIIFTMALEIFPAMMEGLRWVMSHGLPVPMVQDFKEEYPLKQNYRELAEHLGMDTRKSPPPPQKFRDF